MLITLEDTIQSGNGHLLTCYNNITCPGKTSKDSSKHFHHKRKIIIIAHYYVLCPKNKYNILTLPKDECIMDVK